MFWGGREGCDQVGLASAAQELSLLLLGICCVSWKPQGSQGLGLVASAKPNKCWSGFKLDFIVCSLKGGFLCWQVAGEERCPCIRWPALERWCLSDAGLAQTKEGVNASDKNNAGGISFLAMCL